MSRLIIRTLRASIFFSLIVSFLPSSVRAQTFEEYEVKAAFLFQFTKFIEWPEGAETLTLCILENDPSRTALVSLERKFPSVEILRLQETEQLSQCHMFFVSAYENERLDFYLEATEGKNIVTVSEVPSFIEQGGIINFVQRNGKIRFEINQRQAQAQGIKISSKLLSLASRVIKP